MAGFGVAQDGSLGLGQLLYNQITQKAGDTVAATATETNFQSNIPLNNATPVQVGSVIVIDFAGNYTTPGVTAPSTTAKVKIGTTTILATPALSNPAGSNGLGYSGRIIITVLAIGTSGSVETSGLLTFNSSTTASVGVNVPATTTTVNLSGPTTLYLAALFSAATAGNSNTLTQLFGTQYQPVTASN